MSQETLSQGLKNHAEIRPLFAFVEGEFSSVKRGKLREIFGGKIVQLRTRGPATYVPLISLWA